MGRKSSGGPRPLQMAKEYLLANRVASNDEAANALGISVRTVTAARAALISMGLLQRSFFDRSSPRQSEPETGVAPDTLPPGPILPTTRAVDEVRLADLIAHDTGNAISADEARRRVSRIIRAAETLKDPQLELAAIGMFARLDAQLGARDRLGPGPPLTRDAKIQRSSCIFEAIGPSIAGEALVVAFSRTQIDSLLDAVGRRLVRKAENEQSTEENSTEDHAQEPSPSAETVREGADEPQLDGGSPPDGSGEPTTDPGSSESETRE